MAKLVEDRLDLAVRQQRLASLCGRRQVAADQPEVRRALPVLAVLAAVAGCKKNVLWKPFSTESGTAGEGAARTLFDPFVSAPDWNSVPATGGGRRFEAAVRGEGTGALFAVEVASPRAAWRYPDVTRETPYRVLAP